MMMTDISIPLPLLDWFELYCSSQGSYTEYSTIICKLYYISVLMYPDQYSTIAL